MNFNLVSDYAPMGDQPEAIDQLVSAIEHGSKHNTLLGVTGSGKTFTVANVIARLDRPTLVLSHNKTLAAQLYGEFKNFFPENAVEYFVSYYDYYQPEAYLPSTDTYIEKDLSINADIEKMRLNTVATLLSGRRDVIVVSSVSCLYGCGNPADFHATAINIRVGQVVSYKHFLYKLVEALYTRTERELEPATFRVNGDTVDIMAAFGEFGNQCFRVMFYDDEVEAIQSIDPVTGQRIHSLDSLTLYPTSLFVTTKERINSAVQQIYLDLGKQVEFFEQSGRMVEAQRLKQRVEYDVEMIKELGYCPGIENYSRYFDGRAAGTRPFCLLDYFPQDYLMVVDESHVTLPQVHAMYGGDRARKENLVEYGFRLPAAKDNRPLTFSEFEQLQGTTIYVSATPADWELMKSEGVVVEQLIRPTGLVDPPLEVRVTLNQIDDLLEEIDRRVKHDDKILVTTITKRMAEELSKYFDRVGVRNRYIHSDVDTLEAHPDSRGPAGRHVRRAGGCQPAARRARPAGGGARGDSRCRQGGISAQRALHHADCGPRRPPCAGQRHHVRRHLHRIDALRHRAEQPPPRHPGALQHGARHAAPQGAEERLGTEHAAGGQNHGRIDADGLPHCGGALHECGRHPEELRGEREHRRAD